MILNTSIIFKCFVLFSTSFVIVESRNNCYWNSGCSFKLFSSKTSYDYVRGDLRDNIFKIKGCDPISIWSIYRHGHRNPGIHYASKMEEIINLKSEIVSSHANGKSELCAQDIENLNYWIKNDKMFDEPHHLSDEGYEELMNIARRLKEVYPDYFKSLKEDSYIFRAAPGNWMTSSIKAFVEGLAGDKNEIKIEPPNEESDFLAPYENCDLYQQYIKKNPLTYHEVTVYQATSEFTEMKNRIQKRLGINYNLTNENITALYDLCRYSSTGYKTSAPWCALFSADDLIILEYVGDLRHYYRNGYGSKINLKFGGAPLRDLYEQFSKAKSGDGKKMIGYITHATMLDMIYSALGFFKDDFVLNGSNRVKERKWRTSYHAAFSTNIIAVMNKCEGQNSTDDDYLIAMYLNENRLNIYNWKQFETRFKPFANHTIDFCDV